MPTIKIHELSSFEERSDETRWWDANPLKLAVVIHGLISVIVFSPFLFFRQIALWSTDNLFGSYPVIAYSSESIRQGFSRWLPYVFSGVDFTSSISNMSFSPLIYPAYLLPARFFWIGLTVIQFFCFWAIGILGFLFIREVLNNQRWALFSSLIYQLSGSTLYAFQTFPTPCVQVFFLLGCYSMWTMDRRKPVIGYLSIVGSLLGLMWSGHMVYAIHYTLVVIVFFLYKCGLHPRQFFKRGSAQQIFLAAGTTVLFIGSLRWLPFLGAVLGGNRVSQGFISPPAMRLWALAHLFVPEVFGVTNGTADFLAQTSITGFGGNVQGEMFHYYGVLGACFLGLAIFDTRIREGGFWKIMTFFYLAHWTGTMPFAFLSNLLAYPFIHGAIQLGATLTFCITAGHVGRSLSEHQGEPAKSVGANQDQATSFYLQPVHKTMIVVGIIVFVAIASTVAIWHGNWESSKTLVWLLKFILLVPLCSLLCLYASRENPNWFSFWRNVNIGICGLWMSGLAAFTSFSTYSRLFKLPGPSEVFLFGAVDEWLSVALLALAGMWLLKTGKLPPKKLLILGAIGFAMAMIRPIWQARYFAVGPLSVSESEVLVLLGILRLLLVAATFSIALWLRSFGRMSAAYFCGICCLISVVDLLPVFRISTYLVSRPFLASPSGLLLLPRKENLQLDLRNYRVNFPHQLVPDQPAYERHLGNEELSNIPVFYKIPYYGGVNSQYTNQESSFLVGMTGQQPPEIGFPSDSTDDRLLDLVGCRYDFRNGSLMERPTALSRFMLFSDYEVIADDGEAMRNLRSEAFSPQKTLILSNQTPLVKTKKVPAVPQSYRSDRDDVIYLDVSTTKAGLLLFNDTFDKGWKAYLDGRGTDVSRANYKFMAIFIPEGSHSVRFVFDPPLYKDAQVLALIGMLSLAGCIFVFSRGHK